MGALLCHSPPHSFEAQSLIESEARLGNQRLGDWPVSPPVLLCLPLEVLELPGGEPCQAFLHGCWESGPHACAASTLSPAPLYFWRCKSINCGVVAVAQCQRACVASVKEALCPVPNHTQIMIVNVIRLSYAFIFPVSLTPALVFKAPSSSLSWCWGSGQGTQAGKASAAPLSPPQTFRDS